jgi:hypothetical protein
MGACFGPAIISSFGAARLEKEWIATLAQDRIYLSRRHSDGLPRRGLAERRQRRRHLGRLWGAGRLIALRTASRLECRPNPDRGWQFRVCLTRVDKVGRNGTRASARGGCFPRRSSQFPDRAAVHTFPLVSAYATAAAECVTYTESARFGSLPQLCHRAAISLTHPHGRAASNLSRAFCD